MKKFVIAAGVGVAVLTGCRDDRECWGRKTPPTPASTALAVGQIWEYDGIGNSDNPWKQSGNFYSTNTILALSNGYVLYSEQFCIVGREGEQAINGFKESSSEDEFRVGSRLVGSVGGLTTERVSNTNTTKGVIIISNDGLTCIYTNITFHTDGIWSGSNIRPLSDTNIFPRGLTATNIVEDYTNITFQTNEPVTPYPTIMMNKSSTR